MSRPSRISRAARRFAAGLAYAFGYDIAEPSRRRRALSQSRGSEDRELDSLGRARATQAARDLQRKFAIAAWAVRKHLDYVSAFSFRCRTGVVLPDGTDLDQRVEDLIEWWGRKQNFDAAGRHWLPRMLRLIEARRTVDGDVGVLKLDDGRVQVIEGDRIRTPAGLPANDWVHGVRIDPAGRALAYAVHRRGAFGGGYELERIVSAGNLLLHGYYERIDQVRGISPLAPALHPFADVYEAFEYALAKAKVAQMFGLVTYRDDDAALGGVAETAEGSGKFAIDFGAGPFHLDLGRDDKAEFLENRTPSTEFYQFTTAMIHGALKALDLPYSFYDEAHTNFYGSRGALIQYLQSCKAKRRDNVELLTALTAWRLSLFILDGQLVLPRGWRLADLMARVEWVPDGVPWWNPQQEATGHAMLLEAGLTTPQRICQETGTDYYRNIDDIAEAIEYARARGVPLSFAASATGGEEPTS